MRIASMWRKYVVTWCACEVREASAAASASRISGRDIGHGVIHDGDDHISRPVGGFFGRTALGGLGRPTAEMLEDAPCGAKRADRVVAVQVLSGSVADGVRADPEQPVEFRHDSDLIGTGAQQVFRKGKIAAPAVASATAAGGRCRRAGYPCPRMASAMAAPTSRVLAFPPRSFVRGPATITRSIAFMMSAAAAA